MSRLAEMRRYRVVKVVYVFSLQRGGSQTVLLGGNHRVLRELSDPVRQLQLRILGVALYDAVREL